MLDERTLVLEGVTLAQVVELVVQVLIDLAGGAVLDEQAAEHTQTTHPHDLAVKIVRPPICMVFSCSKSLQPFATSSSSFSMYIAYLGILASLVPFLLPKPL